jgi:hypothetical protein
VTDNELSLKARGVARCLSYNGNEHEAAAKHLLHEMAHRLDTRDIRVSKKADGLLMTNGIGRARFMTWRESLKYRLFGIVPSRLDQ